MRFTYLILMTAIAVSAAGTDDHTSRRVAQTAFEQDVRARQREELRRWSGLAALAMTNAVIETLPVQYGIPADRAWSCYTNACGAATAARRRIWRQYREMREALQPDLSPTDSNTKGQN